jgi:hypothetical protein
MMLIAREPNPLSEQSRSVAAVTLISQPGLLDPAEDFPAADKSSAGSCEGDAGAASARRFLFSRSGFDEQVRARATADPSLTLETPADIYA